jgi:hypothetical protein
MEWITIDGTTYNLAHLISFSYRQEPRDVLRAGTGLDKARQFPTGDVVFTSKLVLRFMECGEIVFLNKAADEAWRVLLGVLKPDPIADLLTRIPPPEPR